uniref:C-type lectin domain-containing protein n=1 Tax=Branchiostoma floridae TaxID=7739 RepID=C3YQQ0_BRAFL|eukprot:XP_002601394.1 hypothetical protein BRAFLDRAFT_103428 [Branchiostoma floridae]
MADKDQGKPESSTSDEMATVPDGAASGNHHTAASVSSDPHTYLELGEAGATCRSYIHVDDHVVVVASDKAVSCSDSSDQLKDPYEYKQPENVSFEHGQSEDPYKYKQPEDVSLERDQSEEPHEYKQPEDVSFGLGQPEDPYKYKQPEDVSFENGQPEEPHEYKRPENVSFERGQPEELHEYKQPEDVSFERGQPEEPHEYKQPEDVSFENGQPEDPYKYKQPEDVSFENGQPEDPYEYKQPENVSFCHKARVIRCEDGWVEYSDYCYKVMRRSAKWSVAKSRCHEQGAVLASINGRRENGFISRLLSKANELLGNV